LALFISHHFSLQLVLVGALCFFDAPHLRDAWFADAFEANRLHARAAEINKFHHAPQRWKFGVRSTVAALGGMNLHAVDAVAVERNTAGFESLWQILPLDVRDISHR
jgi:hypothetical protein